MAAVFAEFSLASDPDIAVGLIRDGELLAHSASVNFRLASLSKQFTAMAIMILAERGKLRLDDPLPEYGSGITLRHLLTHRSGLPDYEDLIPPSTTAPLKDKDVLELLRQHDRTFFPPGTAFRYSNTGYVLLGLVVERVSGQSFAEFLRANIFVPLNMTRTVAFEEGISMVSDRAYGKPIDQSVTSATLGDGGIYSSVADLFQWDQSLYTEQLVSQGMLRMAFSASSPTSDYPGSGYGFGWYVRGECLWHYGETCGFSSYIERYPSKKLSVILLANRAAAPLPRMCRELLEKCLPPSKLRT